MRNKGYSNGCVEGLQPLATPAQVSRKNIPDEEDEAGPRLVAADTNVT